MRDRVADAIRYAGWLLDRVDPTHRLSRVSLACRLDGLGYRPWRTRQEMFFGQRGGILTEVSRLLREIQVRRQKDLRSRIYALGCLRVDGSGAQERMIKPLRWESVLDV